ncbi:unnamed protein product, partial [Lampetra planeri]
MIPGQCMTYWIFNLSVHQFVFASLARSDGNTIRYQTNEEGAAGTVIGNLAKDMSLSLSYSSRANFRMMKQFNDSFIRVRESDGETHGGGADRQGANLQTHLRSGLITFDVVSFSRERYKLMHVEVEIKDINDNSPEFPHAESMVEISENAAVGSHIPPRTRLRTRTSDPTTSRAIRSLSTVNFTIDVLLRADGVKYAELVLMKELDRETQSSYTLELVATDGGSPFRSGSTKIMVRVTDFNDNSPVFDQNSFSVSLPEDAPVGTVILDLNAVDADEGPNGEVVYGFGKQVFSGDPRTFPRGQQVGSPDAPESGGFREQEHKSASPPMTSISTGSAHVSEGADRDSLVALVSTSDRDSGVNSQVHCTLYGHDHFKLRQAYEDSYMIVTAASLDRERITQYTIRLSDENDNAPHFTKPVYEVSVMENNAPGAYVATVEATDADLGNNGKITYRLVDSVIMGSPVNTYVSLNSVSGSIYALRSFNYEVMKQLDIHIQASDGGSPQLQSTAVVRPATDADEGVNAQLFYEITEGGPLGFSIDREKGKVLVSRQLTYDVTDSVKVIVAVSDNGSPALTSTAIIHFNFIEGALPSMPSLAQNGSEDLFEWDMSIAIIIVLAGSCSLLLLAIILITTLCSRRKRETREGYDEKEDRPKAENVESGHIDSLIANHKGHKVFDAHPFPEKPPLASGNTTEMSCEDAKQPAGVFESTSRGVEGKLKVSRWCFTELLTRADVVLPRLLKMESVCLQGYSTLPGYGKEALRPITIWKGNSFTTISARDPHISGKDSGKGDSDFNDSDSDISGDVHKKDSPPTNSLWACTSECKVLGHSDRCWSPSATRPNTSLACGPNLSTFSKTASLPRDSRRENYYPAHIPKSNALQSVYEKVQHEEFDYILVGPPTPARIQETDE